MPRVCIVPASEADIDQICLLLTALFSQEADFEPAPVKQATAVRDILHHPDKGHILLLKLDDQVAGMVSLLYLPSTAMGGKVALLEDMIIAENWRGQGYGQRLLTTAIDFAEEQGCLRLTLLTDRDNERAQQLYQQNGFSLSSMVPMRRIFGK